MNYTAAAQNCCVKIEDIPRAFYFVWYDYFSVEQHHITLWEDASLSIA